MTPPVVLVDFAEPRLDGVDSWSPFVMKVSRALRATDVPFRRELVRSPSELRRINPAGHVPVLKIGSEVVCDSTTILARIEALAGTSLGDAEDWLWEELADTSLNGFLLAARWADDDNYARLADAYFVRVPALARRLFANQLRRGVLQSLYGRDVIRAGMDACWARFERLLDLLDARAPDEGFWRGEVLTVADLAMFAQLHSLRTPLTPTQAVRLATRSRLSAWLDRVDGATRPVVTT